MINTTKFLIVLVCFLRIGAIAQELDKNKQYYVSAIGFWNVENLYDTLNDPLKDDEEFTPEGKNVWTGDRYKTKLEHLSEVISQMSNDALPDGLSVLGLCEIENKQVVIDLVNTPKLKARNYQVVHFDGPDARGVDPALIYNPKHFKVTKTVTYRVTLPTDTAHKTREQLVVSGLFNGEPMSFIVCHWPSRRGGESASAPNRAAAGDVARHIVDSITAADPNAKVIVMGDLNDDPINKSVRKHLNTTGNRYKIKDGQLYNAMEESFDKGIGSLAWQDAWNLFDQVIMTKNMVKGDYQDFQYYTTRIFNKPFVRSDFGNFRGYPFRTYSGGAYTAGYSDHFAVYVLLVKEKK